MFGVNVITHEMKGLREQALNNSTSSESFPGVWSQFFQASLTRLQVFLPLTPACPFPGPQTTSLVMRTQAAFIKVDRSGAQNLSSKPGPSPWPSPSFPSPVQLCPL